ncbi:MAG: 30S ribosomal protein S8 [Patescibacteria group bacterium]|jgi:small subunit ribosomal protein S8
MTDPIADMFTRIRNASAVKKAEVSMPMSKLKFELAKIMQREGWIIKAEVVPGGLATRHNSFDELKLTLKYQKNGRSHINLIERISTPGRRVYVDKNSIPVVLNGLGMVFVSTPQGLMTGAEAKAKKIGGELIGQIY